MLLGLEPDGRELSSDPVLPKSIARLEAQGIRGPWGSADVYAAQDVDADFWEVWLSTRDIASGVQAQTSQELVQLLRPSPSGG